MIAMEMCYLGTILALQIQYQISTIRYEYDKSRYNTTSTDFTGLEFIGKSSPHSVSKITYTPPNNGIVQVTTNTWKYDSKGCRTKILTMDLYLELPLYLTIKKLK